MNGLLSVTQWTTHMGVAKNLPGSERQIEQADIKGHMPLFKRPL